MAELVRRPRIRYADIVRAETPTARARYFNDRALGLQKRALNQSAEQFDKSLEFQKQALEESKSRAKTAQSLAGLGLAKSAYPHLKKGISALGEKLFPEAPAETQLQQAIEPAYTTRGMDELSNIDLTGMNEAAIPARERTGEEAIRESIRPAYTTQDYQNLVDSTNLLGTGEAAIAPGYQAGTEAVLSAIKPAYMTPAYESLVSEGAAQTGLGAGEAAIGSEGAAAGGGLSWWGGPVIAAAALGQIAAAGGSKPVEGVAPGHFFSMEKGNWKPRFAEPDKNFLSQQWGGGPTTGARFDARLQKGDIGGAAKAFPGFAHGYAIPGLDVAGNVVEGYVSGQAGETAGKIAQSLVDPVGAVTSSLSKAKDIGDVAKTFLSFGLF